MDDAGADAEGLIAGKSRILSVPSTFSLRETCAPVDWADGRWPQWAWRNDEFLWAGWSGDIPVWRGARLDPTTGLQIRGDAPRTEDNVWAHTVLGIDHPCPGFDDRIVNTLRLRYPGLRAFAAGSLFDGLVMSIVGQSITVKAAAVVLRRVALLFAQSVGPEGTSLLPVPRPDHFAAADRAALRATGLTWRRADALIAAGRTFTDDASLWSGPVSDAEGMVSRLRSLPLVGPWTANATILWGVGAGDVHVSGDVALLRGARAAYGQPDWSMRDLDRQSESWRPARAWAARLIWRDLLGGPPAPTIVAR